MINNGVCNVEYNNNELSSVKVHKGTKEMQRVFARKRLTPKHLLRLYCVCGM